MGDVDLDELRARTAALMARAKTAPTPQPTPTVEPPRRPTRQPSSGRGGSSSWRGQAPDREHLISTHNHGGQVTVSTSVDGFGRPRVEYRCRGCGQEWAYLNDGERPPRMYARPYDGAHRALPYGTRTRGSLLEEDDL